MPAQDKTPGDVASSPASSERPLSEANSSAASLNRSTSAEDASSKRAAFGRSTSGSTTTSPSRPRLTSQTSRDGSIRQRRASYRRQSSFDLAHTNSLASVPDIKRLEALDMSKVPWWTSQRFILSIISFFGFLVLYAQRVNLSIAIVSMVDHSHGDHAHDMNSSSYGVHNSSNATDNSYFPGSTTVGSTNGTNIASDGEKCPELAKSSRPGEFRWNKELQGLVLGSFFWGYLLLQVPGGRLAERIGAKKIIAITMFPVAVLNIISPFCARASPYLFIVVRIFVGLGQGAMYPAAQALWASWAPPMERSRLIGFSYAGGQFGNALIFPIGGFLAAYGFDGGWPSIFYVIGTCGFIWCVVWTIFVYDTPEQNPWTSEIEKKYIKFSLGDRAKFKKNTAIPWKSIFTSRAVWAIIVAHSCGNYGAYMLLTQIPTYMKEVLKFDIKSNGVFSMLPYLVFWFFITVSGMLADFLISRNILTIAWTRKLMACIGMFGPGTFLIGTGFMKCTQQAEAVVMLTIAVGLCGFHFSGYFINHGDIAPPYAGTLFGISNTAATVPGILAPYIVAALTPNGNAVSGRLLSTLLQLCTIVAPYFTW
ncbi:uncharacterized transporter slc-17.2-like isoform X2 [Pomacea canaliculata]|uniref:uncharacterized transporter slc-17.2-like isoform X2 n=1 Tax=Pomacea canaliculata TaxID=400727 RepID=UPI000D731235|nr:uncharacterized transporter slc-17.2-like isoform X2 [Pomacea canaliculata]